ncbi:hypothetical protein D3C85_736840 [compost metagenome]
MSENEQLDEQSQEPAAPAVVETPAVVEPAPEGELKGPEGSGTEPVVGDQANTDLQQEPPAEEVDVVTLARAKYEIDPALGDDVVIEFLAKAGGEGDINLGAMSVELLTALIKGQIRFPESDLKHVIVVYRQRIELPSAWDDKGVINYLRSGEEPKRTSTGAWLVDVTRVGRVPAEWLTSELEAWAKGEIQAGGKSHDNGIALELKARLGLKCEDSPKAVRKAYRALAPADIKMAGAEASTPVVVEAATDTDETEQLQRAKAVTAQIEQVEGLSTMNVALIDDGLARYIAAVAPNSVISEASALKAQNDLDNVLQLAVNLEPQAMVAALNRIKATFKREMAGNGVFSFNNVFRFTHLMRNDNKRRDRHVGMLEAMRVFFADAKEGRKQVDVRQLLQYQQHEKAVLLSEYFTRIA